MEIFGVGPLEFLLILVLALVILGPEDMVGTARKIGQWIYRVVRSPTWRAIISTTQDLRELPQKIIRDAGIEEAMNEIKDTALEVKSELNATTSEISSEMRAAGNAVSSEMGTAFETVKSDATQSDPQPVTNTGYSVWSENTFAKTNPSPPLSVAEIIRTSSDPYKFQLTYFAEALQTGPKSYVDLDHITQPAAPPPPPLHTPELIAGALGSFSQPTFSQSAPANYETGPAMIFPPEKPAIAVPQVEELLLAEIPVSQEASETSTGEADPQNVEKYTEAGEPLADWAKGVPTGLSESDGITLSMDERMRQMTQAIESLEMKNAGEENTNSAVDLNS